MHEELNYTNCNRGENLSTLETFHTSIVAKTSEILSSLSKERLRLTVLSLALIFKLGVVNPVYAQKPEGSERKYYLPIVIKDKVRFDYPVDPRVTIEIEAENCGHPVEVYDGVFENCKFKVYLKPPSLQTHNATYFVYVHQTGVTKNGERNFFYCSAQGELVDLCSSMMIDKNSPNVTINRNNPPDIETSMYFDSPIILRQSILVEFVTTFPPAASGKVVKAVPASYTWAPTGSRSMPPSIVIFPNNPLNYIRQRTDDFIKIGVN